GASTSLSRCWRAGLRRAERSSRALRNPLECWVQPSLSSPSTSVRTGCSNTSTPRWGRGSASRGSVCHRQWTRDLTICRSGVPARGKHPESSAPPKVFEAVGRHVGVPDRVLDVLVSEVVLQGPRVVAIIGQLKPAGMAKHVRVGREWHLGGRDEGLEEAVETEGADRPAALGNEHVSVSRVIAA